MALLGINGHCLHPVPLGLLSFCRRCIIIYLNLCDKHIEEVRFGETEASNWPGGL